MTTEATIAPEQRTRNAAFIEAARAGRSDIAAQIARAPTPADATVGERERWAKRRRLYAGKHPKP